MPPLTKSATFRCNELNERQHLSRRSCFSPSGGPAYSITLSATARGSGGILIQAPVPP
jgi:hypothetical protein